MPFVPRLYTVEEERRFIETVIFPECAVWVATSGEEIVAFLALDNNQIRLLFAHPDRINGGAGGALVDHAKTLGRPYLDLWCFKANSGARRFYERHGFRMVEWSDGLRNEEKLPDLRYFWQPSPTGRQPVSASRLSS